MTQDKPDLGENLLSKAAEIGISSQLDEVEQLNVEIRTDPLKLIQGSVDSITISGEGMVMKQDLRMESIEVSTAAVSVNPLSAALGKIELVQPADADVQVTLTEQDINRAFQSRYLAQKIVPLDVEVQGQSLTVDPQQAQLQLLDNNQIQISASVLDQQTQALKPFSITVIPSIAEDGQKIVLQQVDNNPEQFPELTAALLETAKEMLDLSNFELGGVSLQLKEFEIQPGEVKLRAAAKVEQVPFQ